MSTICEKYLEKDIEQGDIFKEMKKKIYEIIKNNKLDDSDVYDRFYVENIKYGGIQVILTRRTIFKTQLLKELDDYIGFNGDVIFENDLKIIYDLNSQ